MKIVSVSLAVVVILSAFAVFAMEEARDSMVASIGSHSVQTAEAAASAIDSTIYLKRHEMWVFGTGAAVQTELALSNAEFEAMTDREEYINSTDEEWSSTPANETTLLMDQILDGNVSLRISEVLTEHYIEEHVVSIYASIIVVNKYGAVVGMSPRTADYRQNDVAWWSSHIANGAYYGDVDYDSWLGIHGLTVAVPLRNLDEAYAGTIIGFLDVVSIAEEAVYLGRPYETTELHIVSGDGRLIFSDGVFRVFEDISDEGYFAQISEPSGYFILEDGGVEKLFSYAHTSGYLSFPGNDWIVVVDHHTAEVLSSVDALRAGVLEVAVPVLGLSVALSYFFALMMSRRIKNVADSAREFSTGKLDRRIVTKGSDEISQLSESFNKMAAELGSLYHDLEDEVGMRTKELDQANKKLRLLGSITRHDALNQVSIITGWISLAEEATQDEKMLETLRKIKESAVNLGASLEFTGLYEKVGVKKPEWVQMDQALTYSLFGMGPREFELHQGFGNLQVYSDPMIQNVLRNLVDNSVRHGGGVTKISFTYEESPAGLVIIYEDDGSGIPSDLKKAIFEPTKRSSGRKSFGLYLTREILSITGIMIRETGEPGKGARFELHVPKGGFRFQRNAK